MTAELKFDYQQNDHDFVTLREPSVMMVRARRGGSDSSESRVLRFDRHDDRDQRRALEGRARSFPVSQVSRRRLA